MNRLTIALLIGILFLTACGETPSATKVTSIPVIETASATPSPIPTATRTLLPTETASITPLPTIPTFTPTFDVKNILTATLASAANCPLIEENIPIILPEKKKYIPYGEELEDEYIEPILNFLNGGGDPGELLEKLKMLYGSSQHEMGSLLDMTNDGTREVIIDYPVFVIFTCQNDQYFVLYEQQEGLFASVKVIDDINKNGIPEILEHNFISNAGIDIEIDEWNGTEFAVVGNPGIDGGFQYNLIDWDGKGLQEFVFRGGVPGICCEADLNPWRSKTRIYGWNGSQYEEVYQFFDAPQYRFQVIQDADREILYGNVETALKLYQDAIFAENLDWWSSDKKAYSDNVIRHRFEQPTPTPAPPPNPDASEYPRLAAYAYYRIMLLHFAQGNESEAEATYKTLQEKFGSDPYGHPYVEMASAFLEAYQSTHKMYDGCAAAIQYAVEHPEILTPLGSDYHGSQSHIYVPADVCPFR